MSVPPETNLFRSPQEVPIRSLRGLVADAVSSLFARTDKDPSRNAHFISSSNEPNELRIGTAALIFFDMLDSIDRATDTTPGTTWDRPEPGFTATGELLVDVRLLPDYLREYEPQIDLAADVESRLLIKTIKELALRDPDERPGIPPIPQSAMPAHDRM